MSLFIPNSNPSLLRQILGWTVVTLLTLAVLGGSYAFWNSYQEINDFQDDNLKNIARLIADNDLTKLDKLQHYQTTDNEGGLNIEVFPNSAHDTTNKIADIFLIQIPQGLSSQDIAGETWQVYRLDNKQSSIVVRQRMDLQDDLAETSAMQSLLPIVLAIVTLGLLLSYLIWRLFRPVTALATTVTSRQDFDLSPLSLLGLPKEVLPFGRAINQLLAQVKINVERQQRFIADASHELRSPLTAISLQLQRLQRLTHEPKMQEGLDKLAIRVKRNQDLVEQLLTLARLNANPKTLEPVIIRPIIERTINLLLPIVDDKNVQLRVQIDKDLQDFAIKVDNTALTLLIKNLVQNAVLYSPTGGKVSIILGKIADCSPTFIQQSQALVNHNNQTLATLSPHTSILQIIDTGNGINPDSYQQAFEPFVRLTDDTHNSRSDSVDMVKGTGLGLSIVKNVCEQSNINLYLSPSKGSAFNPTTQRGLCISLIFL